MTFTAADKRLEIVVNGQPRDVAAVTTVAALLTQLEISLRGVAVEINGRIVSRALHTETLVAAGDRLEIVSLVGGG